MARRVGIDELFVHALDRNATVTANFMKHDGSRRTMTCRWPDEGRTFNHGNITVWDVGKNGYRSIRPDSILSITVKK